MPGDLSDCPFNWIGILEYHDCLSWDSLWEVLWLLAAKIFLKEINFIILSDTFLGTSHQILSSLAETESGVSVHLLLILLNIACFSVIVILRPTYFKLLVYNDSCKSNVICLPPTTCFMPLLLVATLSVFTYKADLDFNSMDVSKNYDNPFILIQ